MRRVLAVIAVLVVSGPLVACGDDGTSTSTVAVARTSPETSDDLLIDAPLIDALLIDALPDISGPTVLWFWAPG